MHLQRSLLRCLPLWAGLTLSPGLQAQAPASPEATTDSGALERSRATVRHTTEWLARHVDGWFGDKPFSAGGGVTDGELSLNLLQREKEGSAFNVGFNARFRLPNVENHSYVFIGRDNPDEVVADTPKEFSRQERLLPDAAENRSFFAGIGVALREVLELRVGVRGGLKPYAQARYRYVWQFNPQDRVEFRETVFWTLRDQLGSTTALSYEHPYTSTLVFRWLNAATITQQSKALLWSSGAGLAQSYGDQRVLTGDMVVSGHNNASYPVAEYGLQGKWQQPVYENWLIGHVIVGHFWPRTDALSPRDRRWAAGCGVKMLF